MKSNQTPLTGHPYLLLFISILAVSVSSIMIKSSDTPTSVAGMYRLFISVILMLPFVPWKSLSLSRISTKDWITIGLSGLFLGVYFLFWMESLKHTSVASSMVILTLQPFFVMVGSAYMFNERKSRTSMLFLLAALLGSVVIAWGDIGVSKEALLGDGLSLVGAVLVSAYMLAGQKVSRSIEANAYSVIVFFIGGSIMLVYNLVNHYSLTDYAALDWGYFVLLAIIPTIFGQYIFNLLLNSLGATSVSVGIIGEPVLAIILAYLLLGESITSFQFFGALITVLGMAGYFWVPSLRPANVKDNAVAEEPLI